MFFPPHLKTLVLTYAIDFGSLDYNVFLGSEEHQNELSGLIPLVSTPTSYSSNTSAPPNLTEVPSTTRFGEGKAGGVRETISLATVSEPKQLIVRSIPVARPLCSYADAYVDGYLSRTPIYFFAVFRVRTRVTRAVQKL